MANGGSAAGEITLWNARTHGYLMKLSDPGGAGVPGGLEFTGTPEQLADLKDQGILTEAEFTEQKTKILAEMS